MKTKRPHWYQFTLRRFLLLQLLVMFSPWILCEEIYKAKKPANGTWVQLRLSSWHGLREVAWYRCGSMDADVLQFQRGAYLPLALIYFDDGRIRLQWESGEQITLAGRQFDD